MNLTSILKTFQAFQLELITTFLKKYLVNLQTESLSPYMNIFSNCDFLKNVLHYFVFCYLIFLNFRNIIWSFLVVFFY